ncbi:MAG: signal peptidase I [Pirellulales bacterium]
MAKNKSQAAADRNRPGEPNRLDFSKKQAAPLDVARGHAIGVLNSHGIRELVESIVIAFVLAFLFKTFEAEAFVIPTGSMAETLQGRHKDVECSMCGYQYRASSSAEVDDETNAKWAETYAASCPMCGYRSVVNANFAGEAHDIDAHGFNAGQVRPNHRERIHEYVDVDRDDETSYSGDRILVNKFAYEFDDPQRWDVIVFRYPLFANRNYIKRLIGLPGETLEIHRGNVYTTPNDAGDAPGSEQGKMKIARKPPRKIQPMSHIVYDNNYVVDLLTDRGWPTRWQAWSDETDAPGWTTSDNSRSFETTDAAGGPSWIRYQHFPPSQQDWELLAENPSAQFTMVRPKLITDMYSYNSSATMGFDPDGNRIPKPADTSWPGLHWVGDLLLEAEVELRGSAGKLLFDLVKGGLHFTCAIDVTDGVATLSVEDPASGQMYAFEDADGRAIELPTAETRLKGPGVYKIIMANVDDQIALWIDGRLVEFPGFATGTATYTDLPTDIPRSTPDDAGDLAPAGIGVDGADAVVRDIKLSRDVYYIAVKQTDQNNGVGMSDYATMGHMLEPHDGVWDFYGRMDDFFSNPAAWPSAFSDMKRARFVLEAFPDAPEKDQFFAAGDNSPASYDSRLWPAANYFERDLLIGKAVFIYWPHSLNKPVPFFPNFKRMQFVR